MWKAKRSLRPVVTWPVGRWSETTIYFESNTPICPLTNDNTTFMGLRWWLRIVYRRKFYYRQFSAGNFQVWKWSKVRIWKIARFVLQKARPCANPRRLSHFALNKIKLRPILIHVFPQKPPLIRLSPVTMFPSWHCEFGFATYLTSELLTSLYSNSNTILMCKIIR